MSDWEHRRNLRLITVDEIAPSQQIQVSRWLKRRAELLIADDHGLKLNPSLLNLMTLKKHYADNELA